jgi:hypothetical protein
MKTLLIPKWSTSISLIKEPVGVGVDASIRSGSRAEQHLLGRAERGPSVFGSARGAFRLQHTVNTRMTMHVH